MSRIQIAHPRAAFAILLLLLPALLLLTACKGERGAPPANGDGAANAASGEAAPEKPVIDRRTNVESLTIRPRRFSLYRSYIGHLLPSQRLFLKSEIEGSVEKVLFEEGDKVTEGQVLVHVSTRQRTIRRNLARSNLKLADATFAREEKLRRRNLIPASQLDVTRNRVEVARFTLELAELDLTKSIVRAPISGFVKTRGVEPGEFVRKADLLAELLDLERMTALLNVSEKEIGYFTLGKPVTITLSALPGKTFAGQVKTVGLEADQRNRSFPVEVDLDNPDGSLRPGMLARARVNIGNFRNQVLIPRYAILERENSRVVFVEKNGLAEERTIKVGASQDGEVQVLRGLRAGDALIVKGQQKLFPSEPVRVRKTRRQTAAAKGANESK